MHALGDLTCRIMSGACTCLFFSQHVRHLHFLAVTGTAEQGMRYAGLWATTHVCNLELGLLLHKRLLAHAPVWSSYFYVLADTALCLCHVETSSFV